MEDQDHITEFYVMTLSATVFRRIKERIIETVGGIVSKEEEKIPFAQGFAANLAYFRLDFLEPHEVAMGMQFEAILPILWMMGGAKGTRPTATGDVPYVVNDGCPIAVLLQEQKFHEFIQKVNVRPDITNVFIVTNSEDAFFDMKAEFSIPNVTMLYKDYLRNFEINRQWRD